MTSAYPFFSPASNGTVRLLICTERLRYSFAFYTTFEINSTYGVVYPFYFWKPDNLWGAATYLHQGNDDCSYGVWKPKDKHNFYVHDSTKNLAAIGGGAGYPGIKLILDAIITHSVPDTDFYTSTIFIPQETLDSQAILSISNQIDSINSYVSQGRVVWSSLTQMGSAWRTLYQSKPFRIACDQVVPPFVCGDADDNMIVNVSDVVYLISYIFGSGPSPNPALIGDVDCNGVVNISDVVYLIAFIFASGPSPCAGCR